jgi:hypothetical protein
MRPWLTHEHDSTNGAVPGGRSDKDASDNPIGRDNETQLFLAAADTPPKMPQGFVEDDGV